MIAMLLQIWGGLFYLLNKVFFSQAERSKTVHGRKIWRIRSWLVYLAGLPAWVVVFISEHNWIAAGVESGGAPAMLIGLIIAWRGHGTEPKSLNGLAKFSVLAGFILSVYEFGGIKNLNQYRLTGSALSTKQEAFSSLQPCICFDPPIVPRRASQHPAKRYCDCLSPAVSGLL